MIMELNDDKLKELFSNYNPKLSSDYNFMNRLLMNMESVEMIRRHNSELKKRHKNAVIIAAVVGFIAGVLSSFAFPIIAGFFQNLQCYISNDSVVNMIAEYYHILAWSVVGCISVFSAINAYDLSLLFFNRPHSAASYK